MVNRFQHCFNPPRVRWIAIWLGEDCKARYSLISTDYERDQAIRLFDATLYSADRRLRVAGVDMLVEDYCESFCVEQV